MAKNPKITVTETGTPTSRTIEVKISEDPVDLRNEPDEAQIDWEIHPASTHGWTFATKGIVIKDPRFADHASSNGHKRHTWKRKKGQPRGGFPNYKITLTNGTTTVIVDPSINNDI